MKVAILYNVLDRDGHAWRVGGIQTYVCHLAELCLDEGWEAMIFQPASRAFDLQEGRVPIRGIAVEPLRINSAAYSRAVLPSVRRWAESDKLVVIFGLLAMVLPVPGAITIGIQHGIYWDIDSNEPQPPWVASYRALNPSQENRVKRTVVGLLRRTRIGRWRVEAHAYRRILSYGRGYNDVDVRVCVDYNFPNWYRTIYRAQNGKPEYIIINPAQIASPEQLSERKAEQGVIRILFARRFYWYRGTRIMAAAGKRLLSVHPNIKITFAGEGPDGESLKQYFSGESRVQFISYRPEESLQTHLTHDVAVNASLGSEGSSLSVGEAMGAGCTVVATDIGGVTNMIIDGYNGLLVSPNVEALYQGLLRVVTDDNLRSSLAQRAWETAREAFSMERWNRQWREVILNAVSLLR